jgi:hypothetical protein
MIAHVLAQFGLCVHCVFAQCRMIAPTSSLQDWHYGPPPTTMDTVSATIVAGGQAQNQLNKRSIEIN